MIEKYGIPQSIVKSIPEGKVTTKTVIRVACSCGGEADLQIASIIRTMNRVGSYHCLSCGMREKHKDAEFKEKHSSGIKASWTDSKKAKQSEISKALWSDSDFKEHQRQASKKAWSDPEKRKEASERTTSQWDDARREYYQSVWTEEKRATSSEVITSLWEDPEYRKKQLEFKSSEEHIRLQAKLARERWDNPDYRNMVIESHTEMWKNDPSLREKMSERIKQLWNDDAYKAKQAAAAIDLELCRLKAENAKKQWQDPEIRKNIIDKIKLVWEDPEYRKAASETSKSLWNDDSYRKNQAEKRSNILFSGKDTIIERVTQQILDSMKISYERHHVIGYYEFDLFIPSHNLLIECQGEYWHSIRKSADVSKYTYINDYFPEYKILYLWERDFLNPKIIQQKIIESLGLEPPEKTQPINIQNVDVKINSLSTKDLLPRSFYSAPEEFLQTYHSAGYGRSEKAVYGAFHDGNLIGVCKFASPNRSRYSTLLGIENSQLLELDRFCIHPSFKTDSFSSWFMSECTNTVLNDFPSIKSLLGFSDPLYDERSLFEASNWEFVHEIKPDYHYLSQDGFVIHQENLRNHASRNSQNETDYAILHGYSKVYGRSKSKFVYRRR